MTMKNSKKMKEKVGVVKQNDFNLIGSEVDKMLFRMVWHMSGEYVAIGNDSC